MKSPITGKEMVAMSDPRIINYKGKQVEIISYYWLDTDTGDKFEDEQFAELNYSRQTESNIAIIGSRSFTDYPYAEIEILKIIQSNKISKVISGGASGADKIAEMFASKFNIPIEIIPADWSIGKYAGMLRNTEIIQKSDIVIAFWDGKSKGTLDSITKAKRLNKKLFVINII